MGNLLAGLPFLVIKWLFCISYDLSLKQWFHSWLLFYGNSVRYGGVSFWTQQFYSLDRKCSSETLLSCGTKILYENKLLYKTTGLVPTEDYVIELGKANITKEGSDITVVTYGRMLERCEKAAEILKTQGIDLSLIHI